MDKKCGLRLQTFSSQCERSTLSCNPAETDSNLVGFDTISMTPRGSKVFHKIPVSSLLFNELKSEKLDIVNIENYIDRLLDNVDDINSINDDGDSVLHLLIKRKLYNLCELLILCNSFNINIRGKKKHTVLHLLLRNLSKNNINLLKLILSRDDLDINIQGKNNMAALHIAILYRCGINIVKELLINGADISLVSKNGQSPLILAIRSNQFNIVKLLIKNSDNPSDIINQDCTYTSYGCRYTIDAIMYAKSNLKILKYLVKYGANVENLLSNRCSSLDIDVIEFLLDNGNPIVYEQEDTNNNGETIINLNSILVDVVSSRCDEDYLLDIVKLFIKYGANVNHINTNYSYFGDNYSAIGMIIRGNKLKLLKLLLENGGDIDIIYKYKNMSPLFYAINCGSLDIIKYLMEEYYVFGKSENDANKIRYNLIRSKNFNKDTLFMAACRTGNIDIINYLIEFSMNYPNCNINYNVRNKNNETCFTMRCNDNYYKVKKILSKLE